MKHTFCVITTVFTAVFFSSYQVESQSMSQAARTNPEQWRSHQMNQPAPSASDKDNISTDRLEEIKQLYMEAKREAENRHPAANSSPEQLNHQMRDNR